MKKVVLFILLAITLVGCTPAELDNSVETFFTNFKEVNIEEIVDVISPKYMEELAEDTKNEINNILDDEIYKADTLLKNDEIQDKLREMLADVEYLKKQITFNENKTSAEIEVEISYPSIGKTVIYSVGSVYGKLVGEAFSGNELTEDEIEELFVKELLKNLDECENKYVNTTATFEISEIDGQWLITDLDNNAFNAILLDYPKSVEQLKELGIDDDIEEMTESLKIELQKLKIEADLVHIHNIINKEIQDNNEITYDNFIKAVNFEEILDVNFKINKEPEKENIFYISKGEGDEEIIVSALFNDKVYSFNGK